MLRGNTSFTSSTEDAVIWLAGLRARKGTRKVDRTSVRVGTAGTDTFHHEYFHVMMEMLRRGKAMSDDYVRAMASRYPARITRNEPFNEETAGEAYARHAMKAPPGTNSEPWRFGS